MVKKRWWNPVHFFLPGERNVVEPSTFFYQEFGFWLHATVTVRLTFPFKKSELCSTAFFFIF